MREDPIVAEVRLIREQLSAEFDFDVKAIFEDIRKREAAHGKKLVHQRNHGESHATDAADRHRGRASA